MTALTLEQIKEIAETIDCGLICNWNIKSNKLVFMPNDDLMLENDTDAWDGDLNEVEKNSDDFRRIEQPDARESFEFMEQFTATLPCDSQIQNKLLNALSKKKPFREFEHEIANSDEYRKLWFDLKAKKS